MPERHLTAEITGRLREVEPRARLVPAALVRRVIKRHLDTRLSIPHQRCFAIDREALLEIVDPSEIGDPDEALDALVILIAEPEPTAALPQALLRVWRALFHIRLHLEIEARLARLDAPTAEIRARIDRIGQIAFDEIQAVLRQDEVLLPPGNDFGAYVEFAALYLELRRFSPSKISRSFPTLRDQDLIDAMLAEEVDADALFGATRLRGSALPSPEPDREPLSQRAEPSLTPRSAPDAARAQALLRRSEEASRRGNAVRAALAATRAARAPSEEIASQAAALSRAAIEDLSRRLSSAQGEQGATAEAWAEALGPLLRPAIVGFSTVEARLLFDLQKVCVEVERESYKLDLIGWARSKGRRPLMRPLRGHRLVLGVRLFRRALDRLSATRLGAEDQERLTAQLGEAVALAEARLRGWLRPLVRQTLDRVSLSPRNLPEEVACDKLVEELIDRLIERGFLTLGDLRDALSRSHLKLPDMTRLRAFFRGDELLEADKLLHRNLDTAYRRGEVYLRWLQRLSALAFGTSVGRWLTLYLALPFGTAYVALEGLQHLFSPVSAFLGGPSVRLVSWGSLLGLGAAFFVLIHRPALRQALWKGVKATGTACAAAILALPAWLLSQPLVRRALAHPWVMAGWRFGLKPLALSALIWAVLPVFGVSAVTWGPTGGVLFLIANAMLNSRLGRRVEDRVVAWVLTHWHELTSRLLPGLFEIVVKAFKRATDWIEQLLYSVDEWLRFKSSDGQAGRVIKGVLGAIWSVVVYVVRIYITLLIEPQINPIKHFPVVTVSHKIILPMTLKLTALMAAPLSFLGPVFSNTIAGTTVFLLPGVFGFLVWELKENWRLYSANRPASLEPVMVGHHGETMLRLMKPGFHSGTLPKLFGKLRQVEERGSWREARKHQRGIDLVQSAVGLFIERELIALLNTSGQLPGPIALGEIHLGSNRVTIQILGPGGHARPLQIAFEEQSGWLVGHTPERGWLDALDPPAERCVESALEGLFKLGGVALVREQIEALLPPGAPYDISDQGLLVWPGSDYGVEVLYDLGSRPVLTPTPGEVAQAHGLSPIKARDLVFAERSLPWEGWVARWARKLPSDPR